MEKKKKRIGKNVEENHFHVSLINSYTLNIGIPYR